MNVTPFEPEWEGTATLEISNTTPLPAKIYANEGIALVVFFTGRPGQKVSSRVKCIWQEWWKTVSRSPRRGLLWSMWMPRPETIRTGASR